jgi:hypothetical protein
MKSKDYVPSVEANFVTWAKNFVNVFIACLAKWLIPENEGSKLNELHENFLAKYLIALNPATKTKVAIQDKNDAKKALIAGIRRVYRMYIVYNEHVTRPDRDLLKVPIHHKRQHRIPAPDVIPEGLVSTSTHLIHKIVIIDLSDPLKKKQFPKNVTGFEIWRIVGGMENKTEEDFAFVSLSTTTSAVVEYEEHQLGTIVHYRFRWVNARGKSGPWSVITKAVVS